MATLTVTDITVSIHGDWSISGYYDSGTWNASGFKRFATLAEFIAHVTTKGRDTYVFHPMSVVKRCDLAPQDQAYRSAFRSPMLDGRLPAGTVNRLANINNVPEPWVPEPGPYGNAGSLDYVALDVYRRILSADGTPWEPLGNLRPCNMCGTYAILSDGTSEGFPGRCAAHVGTDA